MYRTNKVSLHYLFSACVVLLFLGLIHWLNSETEVERARNFFIEYRWLVIQGEKGKAKALFDSVLTTGGDEPIDKIWLPLVQFQEDGYSKLINYSRLLAGDTEREATYAEISYLISRSPEEFQDKLKDYYLTDLLRIPDVRKDLVEKYGLMMD
jgi:hypothetical protein